jgi:uncharacterized membrane protein YkoI
MTAIKKPSPRNPRALAALLTALGLLMGGSLVGVAAVAKTHAQAQAPYKSSIQVPDDDKGEREGEREEAEEGDEGKEQADEANEASEAARYQSLARITADQARTAALATVPGTATSVELENEDGNLVYGVSVKTATGESDVKVDAGNGKVLHVEQGERD